MRSRRRPFRIGWRSAVFACALAAGCRCHGPLPGDAGASWLDAGDAAVDVVRPAEVEQLWAYARDGGDDELERLALVEGQAGLAERAADPARRATALRAMAFVRGYAALPLLGAAARHGAPDEALAAVASADAIAARKRAQVDPEDADELRSGCAELLAAAKDPARPREVRVGAVRALRMLADGDPAGTPAPRCVAATEIPADVDAK